MWWVLLMLLVPFERALKKIVILPFVGGGSFLSDLRQIHVKVGMLLRANHGRLILLLPFRR